MPASVLGLRTTFYKVPDLDAAKAWYAKAFQTEPYYDQAPYVGFNIADYELGLFLDAAEETSTADNVLSYWDAGDISVAMAHFQSLDASVHEAPMKTTADQPPGVKRGREPFGPREAGQEEDRSKHRESTDREWRIALQVGPVQRACTTLRTRFQGFFAQNQTDANNFCGDTGNLEAVQRLLAQHGGK